MTFRNSQLSTEALQTCQSVVYLFSNIFATLDKAIKNHTIVNIIMKKKAYTYVCIHTIAKKITGQKIKYVRTYVEKKETSKTSYKNIKQKPILVTIS